jgi:hypothetical protein
MDLYSYETMSDTDSDVPVKRRVVKKKKPASAKKLKRQPVKPRVKGGKRRPLISSEDESESSESSESDAYSGSDHPSDSEEEKEGADKVIPAGNFTLPDEEEQPKVWVLVGACASGKTHMLKFIHYLYAKRKHFKFGITYTPTKFTGDYNWAPDRSIMAFDEDHFKSYIDSLKKKVEEGVEKHGNGFKLPHNYVVFDDNNGVLTQSPFMINFISTHRHTSTTVFVLSQLLTARGAVSTTMRANTSFALMWPTSSGNAIKGLFDNYGGLMNKDEFKDALNSCRERKFSCLVLKNSPDHQTIAEQFTTIKARDFPKDFKILF